MAKTSVEDLKARFKRGMYPTEGDFANVFDSYVHKDDGIYINDVTADNGSKTLTTLLQEFKQEILQDAKNQETQYDDSDLQNRVSTNENNISSLDGRVSTNEGDISTLKDDLDTAEDYIAGHESRIQALEERAEVPEGLAEFIEKVNSFLDDADASDATINKWKEIEAFLTGITDTETLTGLLADLKAEILDEIPEQKEYTAGDGIDISEDGVISLKEDENKLDSVKVIADLDASEAPKGTVAIYTGDTNDKYTHGFIYEKTGEGGVGIRTFKSYTDNYIKKTIPAGDYQYNGVESEEYIDLGIGGTERKVYQLVGPDGDLYWTTRSPNDDDGWADLSKDMLAENGENYRIWNMWQGGTACEMIHTPSWTPLHVMNVIN